MMPSNTPTDHHGQPIDLAAVLAKHAAWLRGETGGERANLTGANLTGANLSAANLSDADLLGANLSAANLSDADLLGANLYAANLTDANLSDANLTGANLYAANLTGARLTGARLTAADLTGANLTGANLTGTTDGHVCRMDFGGWSICVRAAETSIGCQVHANESWLSWSPESPEIIAMHCHAPDWWRVHGDVVKAAIRCVMAKAAAVST